MLACILASLPVLGRQLAWSHLRSQPGILAVAAMLPAIMLSQLARRNTWMARQGGTELIKVVAKDESRGANTAR